MAATFGWRPFCYPRFRITSGALLPKSSFTTLVMRTEKPRRKTLQLGWALSRRHCQNAANALLDHTVDIDIRIEGDMLCQDDVGELA